MKSITEFWSVALTQAMNAKNTLTGEGKTAEEISASLGEKFKLEGDKLKHFINAIEVAVQNPEKLSRVLVVSLNEGENAPPKSIKIEEFHYVPEFQVAPRPVQNVKSLKGGGQGKGGGRKEGRGGAPKSSPWGLTPEEKAAKKGGGGAKPAKPS